MKHPQYYLLEAIKARNDEDVSSRNDYSGRGMFGKRCMGITGPYSRCMEVISEAIVFMAGSAREPHLSSSPDDTHEFFARAVKELLSFELDSMGRTNVILYWPNMEAMNEVSQGC